VSAPPGFKLDSEVKDKGTVFRVYKGSGGAVCQTMEVTGLEECLRDAGETQCRQCGEFKVRRLGWENDKSKNEGILCADCRAEIDDLFCLECGAPVTAREFDEHGACDLCYFKWKSEVAELEVLERVDKEKSRDRSDRNLLTFVGLVVLGFVVMAALRG